MRPIKEGDIVTVEAVEWIDPYWDFNNPCVVLKPIYREYETSHLEHAIEDVMLDLISGETEGEDPGRWNPKTVRARFRGVIAGKRRGQVAVQRFEIYRDEDGLMFRDAPAEPPEERP